MVSVSACVNLPLHHKGQKWSFGTGSPGWYRKKGRKTVVVVVAAYMTRNNPSPEAGGSRRIPKGGV